MTFHPLAPASYGQPLLTAITGTFTPPLTSDIDRRAHHAG